MDRTPDDERASDDLQTIDLPQLEELEFGFVDVTYAIDLLSLFAFPNLRVLSVEDVAFGIRLWDRQDCSRLFDHLVEMSATERASSSSSCVPLSSLRELSLRSIDANDTSIHRLFGRLCALTSLCLDRVDVTSLLAICSALQRHACDRLHVLTLKDIDSSAAASVLSSYSFPPRLRVFLDIEDTDRDEEEEEVAPLTASF